LTLLRDAEIDRLAQAGGAHPESNAERMARLDAERNERDRRLGRGYDYERSHKPSYVEHVSPHVDLVIEGGDRFGLCEVCGDPAGIVVPPEAAIDGARRFCGAKCLALGKQRKMEQEQAEAARALPGGMDTASELPPLRDAGIDHLVAADTGADPYESARALAQEAQRQHRDLADYLCEHRPDLLSEQEDRQVTAAESVIGTYKRLGIALRVDADGSLVIGREELRIPPSLVMATEAQVDEIIKRLKGDCA
jgi:hypothetical protein